MEGCLANQEVANMMHIPLYPMSAGELGSDATKVENQLRQALVYCKEWNAVLLLDESDVFLQKRSAADLQRSELVSSKSMLLRAPYPCLAMNNLTRHSLSSPVGIL